MSNRLTQIDKLQSCISQCKSWIPHIEITSTHFYQDEEGQIKPNYERVPCQVNISNFLSDEAASDVVLKSFRSTTLQYPCSNSLLEIEGYVGVEKESEIVTCLKEAALDGGTIIVRRDSRNTKG